MRKNSLSIFDTKQKEVDDTQADMLALRNTLQAVAQMRKLQREIEEEVGTVRGGPDLIRLQNAVDIRLASLGIKAI